MEYLIGFVIYLAVGYFGSALKERYCQETCFGIPVQTNILGIIVYTLFWPFILIGKLFVFVWEQVAGY